MEKELKKKQKKKYEERAVIIGNDILPPDHAKVKEAKKELRKIQQEYVNMTVNDFAEQIEAKKQEITDKITEFVETQMVDKYDSDGKQVGKKLKLACPMMDEYVINRIFFNSLSPLSSKEPTYNAEKLAIVFDFYENTVAEINAKICKLIPSKSHFCRFAGITTATYNGYKQSDDPDMQVVIGKIEDMLLDVHLTMAEEMKTSANAMKYRMNVEMDKRENYNPQVVIKAEVKSLDDYKDRLNSLESMVIEGERADEWLYKSLISIY